MTGRLIATLTAAALLFASVAGLGSVEAGANAWTANGPSVPGLLWRLALDPTRTATVYAAGSTGTATSATPRVFKTTDAGTTWVEATNGIVNVAINALAVDPANGTTLYVGGYNPVAKALALYRSTDGGATWILLGWPLTGADLDRQVMAVGITPTNPSAIYAGTTGGILKSVNRGDSWSVLAGLPVTTFRSIVVDRASPNTVYAAGDAGVYRSTDAGATWGAVQSGLPLAGTTPRVNLLVADPADARVIYAVAATSGGNDQVFRSGDGGSTWATASGGLPNDVIRDLAVDPRTPRTLYAALNGGSGQNLVRSLDAGVSWQAFSLPGGGYSSSIVADALNPQSLHAGHNDALWSFTFGATGTVTPASSPTPATSATPSGTAPRDSRFFTETGFRVDNDAIWDYFNRRGGVRVFGYPTSRTFLFLGFNSQFFQRAVMQIGPDGSVRLLNLLDPGLLPYTTFNGAQMPAIDPALVAAAPPPGSPAVLDFVRANAPNSFDGQATNYGAAFEGTVTLQVAYPQGGGNAGLLPGLNLEIWGVPTSRPTYDPNNRNFIYQRFQRGIMHYDVGCVCTNGILLADYLKAIITGQGLPADLAAQAAGSPFMRQYDSTKPSWIARTEQMPGTNLTSAFEKQ